MFINMDTKNIINPAKISHHDVLFFANWVHDVLFFAIELSCNSTMFLIIF